MRLTLMNINEIRKDAAAGLTHEEIAELRGISKRTVWAAINNKIGKRQRQKADRMEYFSGEAANETGNFSKKYFYGEDGPVVYEQKHIDSVAGFACDPLEELLAWEEIEERMKKSTD